MLGNYQYKNTGSSAAVKSGPGGVHSVNLAAGGDAATLILYDNTAGSGTVICKLAAIANGNASVILDVAFSKGCYAAVTGTGPSASVSFW